MWRLYYRSLRGVTSLQHWLSRRFSRAGLFVLGAAVLAAALGADTRQTLAYQIFAFLAALAATALVAGAFLRVRVRIKRSLPRAVSAGEPFFYTLRIRNPDDRPVADLTLLEDLRDPRPGFDQFRRRLKFPSYRGFWRLTRARQIAEVDEVALPALPAGGEARVRVAGRTYRRGVLHFEGATVTRADPTGLFRACSRIAQPANLIVLPRRYALPPLSLPGSRMFQHGGVTLASSVGDSEEFMGLRDYRPGDPLQRVHWKSFARAGKPIVREYQDEFFERHALVLDTFGGESAARSFEEAVSVAASFAYTLDTRECLLDLLFVGEEAHCYTAGRGQMQPASLLEVLAGARLCGDKPVSRLRDAVLARRAALSGCVLILLGWDEPRSTLVHALRAQGLPLLVLAIAEHEPAGRPPWLRLLQPGRIQQGLAQL